MLELSTCIFGHEDITIRELGKVFQLRRMPSRSSIWLHWSFNASKSMFILCELEKVRSLGIVEVGGGCGDGDLGGFMSRPGRGRRFG